MKKNIIQLGFVLSVFCGVNQTVIGQTNNNDLIRISCDFKKSGLSKMSDLFSEIRYIPLETNVKCLIGNMNIPVFGEEIIVNSHDSERNIYRFSDQGKFINKIGNLGRGPTEYQDNCEVRLIGDTVYVVSMFSNSIYVFSGQA